MEIPKISSAYKLRMFSALLLLALGFFGVILTDVKKDGAWEYWQALCVVFALVSLLLSGHFKKKGWKTSALTLWHEIAHWTGLISAIFVISYFVRVGLFSRFNASIVTLLLLALTTYLAGIYIEKTLIFIGIVLGVFAIGIAFTAEYLYTILLPLTVLSAILLIAFVHRAHKKLTQT